LGGHAGALSNGGAPVVAGSGGAPSETGGTSPGGTDSGGSDAGVDPCAVAEFEPPTLLSETGLYADAAADVLADGVRPFEPKYALWSDGSVKRRWVYIPPCSQIDTTDPDYWQ
jgi:hypothetical protein